MRPKISEFIEVINQERPVRLFHLVFHKFTKLVYLSAVNADVQGTAKWIGNSCASPQSAFQAVVACYAVFLNQNCALDITRQQQLTFNCMGNRLLGLQMFLRSSFQGLG